MLEDSSEANDHTPKRYVKVALLIGAAVFILDQATKMLAVYWWRSEALPIEIFGRYFRFVHAANPGAAWGMFSDYTGLLTIFSLLVMILLIWQFPKMTEGQPERVAALAALIGGVAGNLVDRAVRGEVVDFIDVHLHFYNWPVFNIADSAITLGVIVFAISVVWREASKKDLHEAN